MNAPEFPITLPDLATLCRSAPKEELLGQLRTWGLIPAEGVLMCPNCGNPFRLNTEGLALDGWRWYCGRSTVRGQNETTCQTERAFRTGTLFDGSQLDMLQLRMAHRKCVNWSAFCREVVLEAYIRNPERLGGPGKVVEIEKSKFGRRRYHRGRHIGDQWVIGAYERGTGKVFLATVEALDSSTLITIIQELILSGTTLVSDIWRTYNCLENIGFQQLMTNHSITFKDLSIGVHTKGFEKRWHAAKSAMNKRGVIKTDIGSNLARYLFLKRCRDLKLDHTREFYRLASKVYDPTRESLAGNEPERVRPSEDNEINDDDEIDFVPLTIWQMMAKSQHES